MNVSRLFPGSASTSGPTADAAETDRGARPAAPVAPSSPAGGSPDRFELSDAARARQEKDAARQAEIDSARTALRSQPGLSEERTAEIQQRIAEGYYDSAEVTESIAEKLANVLGGA